MKGIIAKELGAPFELTDALETPEPNADQLLVKSIYTAINPVDEIVRSTGIIAKSWPFVPGVDASGVVVKVGENAASKFKVGDYICGCTRVGTSGHGTCQEYFLMDAKVAIPKPKNVSLAEAATIGVGLETSAIGIFSHLNVEPLPLESVLNDKLPVIEGQEWAVVLGGSSSLGKFAVQLLDSHGFKVIASCSAKSAELVRHEGAQAVFNYKDPVEDQVKTVLGITKGHVHRVFDAAATGDAFAKALFKEVTDGPKFFSTSNTWSGITSWDDVTAGVVELAPVGSPEAEEGLNKPLAALIPVLVELFERKWLRPSLYDLVGETGFDSCLKAFEYQKSGAGGAHKVVAKIQDE
ncbi:hypothetical protein FQN57_006113 [Myotisia sp. PD_48]|nr:hypothetical protein FQN57_006113 [Myotisia sp. PD_48]